MHPRPTEDEGTRLRSRSRGSVVLRLGCLLPADWASPTFDVGLAATGAARAIAIGTNENITTRFITIMMLPTVPHVNRRCGRSLHIELEMQHIAIGDDIVFAFLSQFAGIACRSFPTE